jgi:hypothetical protein
MVRDNVGFGNWQEMELGALLTEIAEQANGEAIIEHLGLRDDELRNVLASAGIGEAVDPFTMREQDTLPAEAGGPRGRSGGDSGMDGRGEPLTVVLRFPDVVALTDTLGRLRQRRWHETLGYVEVRGHDQRGNEIG